MADGLVVSRIIENSIAAEMEIEPGDVILSVGECAVADILDLQYLTTENAFTLVIQKQNEEIWELDIEKDPEEILGIEVVAVGREGLMQCRNNCVFCFVRQMPTGMRPSLYDFDDDYRMSVTQGNYITLSNLEEKDFNRIIQMRLSPLYISVHAWNPAVREKLMGNKQTAKLPEQMQRLAAAGLTLHTQIVLVPGYNDGDILEETVEHLAALYPSVQSIGIVPVGLTKYREKLPLLHPFTPAAAEKLILSGMIWQKKYHALTGMNLVYLSDEFYVLAGRAFPESQNYDDYPQLENGIGMVRKFEDEIAYFRSQLPKTIPERRIHLVTGTSAAAFFRNVIAELADIQGLWVTVHEIKNQFFGTAVTVAGLLTAQDIADQLGNVNGEFFLIPTVMLKADEDVFLDDHDIGWLAEKVNGKAIIVENHGQSFLEALFGKEIGGFANE
ncbi:DUF512 domain-containing protein [Dehalobacter sp. DCM]|uniref:DUF512 domain-containing protein n=1 Tax=Dehalobacter sp. DCM TaxID=2907827 RepID=UPI003081F3A2|nr:DUF512 domain-containing protein [Dehalobacter sp. DCM]